VIKSEDNRQVLELFNVLSEEKISTWLSDMSKSQTWGDTNVSLFVAYIYQLNVRVISNNLKGFIYFDVREISEARNYNILPDEDVDTIYI